MKHNINIKIAVGTNHMFTIVNPDKIKNISLKNTNTLVNSDGYSYPLYTGATPDDLQKINKILTKDNNDNERKN